ncbi:MAG: hypothetical protein RL308_1081 [Bacteroidota bacterium]|jgi:hypothetical protein
MGYLFTISLLTSIKQLIINNLNFIIMKKLFFFIAFLFAAANSFAQTSTYVSGYTNSNGTYVQGYYRTTPNTTRNDNYSTVGNVNPYTGSYGTKPADSYYSSPSYYSTSSYTTPVYTGSRGGQYYINSNGNKSYISR